ncbi:MAG TPA: branched-chain amino acid transaminase [Bdellovibrionota bacterium]|nr:branched-chain amino acid transaminase [Bdellovibrionota bacterium]
MYQKTEKIWMDGRFVSWGDANVHVLTHTLHYGVGIFEGIRYYDCGSKGTAVFRLRDHMRRFDESARIVEMKLPYRVSDLVEACVKTVRENKLKEGYLRPLAFITGAPGMGIWAYDNPISVAIITWGWGAYLGAEGVTRGIRMKTSSYTRHHRNIGMTKAKVCGQYFNSVLAKREAKMSGYDEALLLDPEGYVAEATGENLFMVRDGVVRTPPLGSILSGLTRNTVMTLLREWGTPVVEEQLTRDDLYVADEVFLTGTAAEVTPVREVDTRIVGAGKPGPMTQKIQNAYGDLIRGKNDKHKEWLTFV